VHRATVCEAGAPELSHRGVVTAEIVRPCRDAVGLAAFFSLVGLESKARYQTEKIRKPIE
jgi:hypothetical protein